MDHPIYAAGVVAFLLTLLVQRFAVLREDRPSEHAGRASIFGRETLGWAAAFLLLASLGTVNIPTPLVASLVAVGSALRLYDLVGVGRGLAGRWVPSAGRAIPAEPATRDTGASLDPSWWPADHHPS